MVQQRSAAAHEPNVTISAPGVSDPAARFILLVGTTWFIAWCMTAITLLRHDWPSDRWNEPAGVAGLLALLLSSFALAVRLRRLDAGVRERYAAALQQTNALLRDLVDQDDLTGLLNRRYFVRRLEEELARARRQGTELTLLVADLDGFKQVNDKFGHQVGDRVLKEFARRLRAHALGNEVVCRIGGDEFAVLAPGAGAPAAAALCERINSLAAIPPPWSPGLEGPDTIQSSAGAATLDSSIPDASALLNRADQALYADKRRHSRGAGTVPAA